MNCIYYNDNCRQTQSKNSGINHKWIGSANNRPNPPGVEKSGQGWVLSNVYLASILRTTFTWERSPTKAYYFFYHDIHDFVNNILSIKLKYSRQDSPKSFSKNFSETAFLLGLLKVFRASTLKRTNWITLAIFLSLYCITTSELFHTLSG